MSNIQAVLPPSGRDLRLDLFRGVANWAIYLDHIPHNVVAWVTTRNYGFSDAADLFVFISGYTASFVYAKVMLERGFVIGAAKLFRRVWQLYVAHMLLFVVYIAITGYFAQRYNEPDVIYELNIAGLIDNPVQTIFQGLILKFKPTNLDVLPLYIVLMMMFPFALWCMLRKPDLTLVASIVLYFAARAFGWNFPSFPEGGWYFNPFTWQLLFMFGAWFALGGAMDSRRLIRSRWLLYIGLSYLLFAAIMTLAGSIEWLKALIPQDLFAAFNPNDKTNLAPYRVIHFVIIAFFVTRFVPRNWKGLEWPGFRPALLCGQHSLEVFCVGSFLALLGHFLLMMNNHISMHFLISFGGIALLCAFAYAKEWSAKMEKKPARMEDDGLTPARKMGASILTRPPRDKAAT